MTQKKEIQKQEKSVVQNVTERVNQLMELGQLHLPKDYSAPNAVRAAWLVLQDQTVKRANKEVPVLSVVDNNSVVNAMFKMVISGLSVAKGQGDFIPYGNKLSFNPEYHGNKILAKRWAKVVDVTHNTIYESDEFDYVIDSKGRKQIKKHIQPFTNIDMTKIIGAYCTVTFEDGTTRSEVMNMKQIKMAWQKGATKGQSPAHREFPDRMAEKTVANRLLTELYRASDDGAIYDSIVKDIEGKDGERPAAPIATPSDEAQDLDFDEYEEVKGEDNPKEKEPEKPKEEPKQEEKKKEEPVKEQPKKPEQKQGEMFKEGEPKKPF